MRMSRRFLLGEGRALAAINHHDSWAPLFEREVKGLPVGWEEREGSGRMAPGGSIGKGHRDGVPIGGHPAGRSVGQSAEGGGSFGGVPMALDGRPGGLSGIVGWNHQMAFPTDARVKG